MPIAARMRGRPAKRSRPIAAGRRQRRPIDPDQHANRSQPANQIDDGHNAQPRRQARPKIAQRCHPLAQSAAGLHHVQAKLAQHPTAHYRLVKPQRATQTRNPPPLGPPLRTLLVLDQLLWPALTPTPRNRRTN